MIKPTDAGCNAEAKLVETKLEMVRAAGLFHCSAGCSSYSLDQ